MPEALLAAGKRQTESFPKWVDDNADPWVVKETSQGIRRWITNIMVSTRHEAVLELYQAYAHTDFREDVKALMFPVLQIHGDRDASVPVAFGQMTASMTSHCRFVIYEGAPHGLIVTHKERLDADILKLHPFVGLAVPPLRFNRAVLGGRATASARVGKKAARRCCAGRGTGAFYQGNLLLR